MLRAFFLSALLPLLLGSPQQVAEGIDFETLPGGEPACSSCALTDQYAAEWGVEFSFRSWQAEEVHAQLIESTSYDPPELDPNHSVTAALTSTGFHPGILTLSFPAAPAAVQLTVRGSDVVQRFAISAVDGDGNRLPESAIRRTGRRDYRSAGGGGFREVRVAVASDAGVSRVELDGYGPPGHILLVDDLVISGRRRPPGSEPAPRRAAESTPYEAAAPGRPRPAARR